MAEILVRVGAAIDPSIQNVFRSIIDGSNRASEAVGRGAKRGATTQKGELAAMSKAARAYADSMRAIDKARADQAAKDAARATKAELKAFDERIKAAQRASREKAKMLRDEEREIMRTAERAARAEERARARGAARKDRASAALGRGFVNNVQSNIGGVARAGARIGGELGRGFGVDSSLGGGIDRAVSLESVATDIVNSAAAAGKMEATAANVQKVLGEIRAAANDARVGFDDMAGGVQDFVAKSADIDAARKHMAEIAKIAQATGTNAGDLLSMGGDLARSLPESEKESMIPLMRLFAKQGAMGNVEVRDLAKYGGRMVSTAFQYEGSREENFGRLGAMAQVSMRGGRSSAAEAARASAAFARDITKEAAGKRLAEAGIDVYADKDKTKIRNQEDIIVDVFRKTGGSQADLANLFQNEMSRSILLGFGDIYEQGGGGEAGIRAIKEEFKKFTTTMSADDVNKGFTLKADSDKARAQLFQNRLDEMSARVVERVVPALEKLEPSLLSVADGFAGLVAWSAENPGAAITGAIVASIAKAGIESSISGALSGLGGASAGAVGALGAVAAAGLLAAAGMKTFFDLQADQATSDASKNTDRGVMADALVRAREKQARGQTDFTPLEREALGKGGLDMQREMMRELELADRARNPLANVKDLFMGALTGGPEINNLLRGHDAANRVEETRGTLAQMGGAGLKDPFAESASKIAAAADAMAKAANITVTINTPQGVNEGARDSGSISGGRQ